MTAVAIVIPARNVEGFIRETLDSVAAQTRGDFECVVVDDGSTDSTREIAEAVAAADPRFRVVTGPSRGAGASRNKGLALTTAPLVIFLDSDDLFAPDTVERACAAMGAAAPKDAPEDAPDYAPGALGEIARIDESGAPLPGNDNRDLMPARDQLRKLLRKNFIVNGGALILRRSAIDRAGPMAEDIVSGQDWEFWCRIALLGDFRRIEGGPVLYYRQRRQGLTGGRAFAQKAGGAGAQAQDLFMNIRRVRENPEIRRRVPELDALLRRRELDAFWNLQRARMQQAGLARAALLAAEGVAKYPRSLLEPALALRFLKSLKLLP